MDESLHCSRFKPSLGVRIERLVSTPYTKRMDQFLLLNPVSFIRSISPPGIDQDKDHVFIQALASPHLSTPSSWHCLRLAQVRTLLSLELSPRNLAWTMGTPIHRNLDGAIRRLPTYLTQGLGSALYGDLGHDGGRGQRLLAISIVGGGDWRSSMACCV